MMGLFIGQLSLILIVSIGFQGKVLGKSLTEDERDVLMSLLAETLNERESDNDVELRGSEKCKGDVCVMQEASIRNECLAAHNTLRRLHGASPLEWEMTPSQEYTPEEWAERLAKSKRLEHDKKTTWGENIYMTGFLGEAPISPCADAVEMWYSEIKDYNFKKPGFYANTGHFTQVVWKATTDLHCGVAYNTRFGVLYTVCRYYIPGNMMGQYEENVE